MAGNSIAGVLAIGKNTPSWVIKRGMEPSRVYSFAYFLKDYRINHSSKKFKKKRNSLFRFVYVGNLIKRKNVDNLINAVAKLKLDNIELWIVGKGPEENYLRSLAKLYDS